MKRQPITADDIEAATRALRMAAMNDRQLGVLRDTHALSERFASRAIILAVDQVLAGRIALRAKAAQTEKGTKP